MNWKFFRLAHKDPGRELIAGLALVLVFWIVMHIEGYLYLEGIHTYQGALIHFLALIVALIVADMVGYISYTAIALIVLVGITGYISMDYYLFTIQNGGTFVPAPWYAYLFPSVFACMVLWWIRLVKTYLAEQRAARAEKQNR